MDPPLKKAVARNINNYFYHQSPQRSLKALVPIREFESRNAQKIFFLQHYLLFNWQRVVD